MPFRVQFTISDKDKLKLEKEARKGGYPNISSYVKSFIIPSPSPSPSPSASPSPSSSPRSKGISYVTLYRVMLKEIAKLPKGTRFRLRDIIKTPPALIGRWLFEGVATGRIPNVEHYANRGSDAHEYIKL